MSPYYFISSYLFIATYLGLSGHQISCCLHKLGLTATNITTTFSYCVSTDILTIFVRNRFNETLSSLLSCKPTNLI